MSVWCMAHPWMTFFIVLSFITGIVEVAKTFNHTKDDDEDNNQSESE